MGPGQDNMRRHRTDCDRLVLDIGNIVVGWPVVRHQTGLGGHGAEHEGVDLLLAEALDHLQPSAPRRAAVNFDRAGDQHLADPTAACRQNDRVVLGAERDDRLVSLDHAAQRLALRVDHGAAQLGAQHPALQKLVGLAKRNDVVLWQSYLRVAKRAAIMVGRYTPAHQFKRARRELKFLRTRLGRVIRDLRRKTAGDPALSERFAELLGLAGAGALSGPPPARPQEPALGLRPEGLRAARAGGRMHRQRQSAGAVRVWLQSVNRHPSDQTQRRVSSCCTPRRCTAIRLTATPWPRWSPNWNS